MEEGREEGVKEEVDLWKERRKEGTKRVITEGRKEGVTEGMK